jgi:hypothetical protein
MSEEKKEVAIIEELKKKNPSGVFEGEISFTDADDNIHKVEFIFRTPTTADIEAHTKTASKNPIVANLNLIQSLIVHPEPGPIIEQLRYYPVATGRFVDEAISPFFGGNVTARKKRL